MNAKTYLALGDSYTIGELVSFQANFPYQTVAFLKEKKCLVAEPVIIATTGWTTDELNTAIKEKNVQETFDFVTLLIGVNNQYRGRSVENFEEEFNDLLSQAIHFAKGNPSKVIVLSIPDWGVTPFASGKDSLKIAVEIDAYNHICEQMAVAKNCHFLNITDSTRINGSNPDYLVEDLLHPSEKEYAVWASRLGQLIISIFK